jgi:hypothetical protein
MSWGTGNGERGIGKRRIATFLDLVSSPTTINVDRGSGFRNRSEILTYSLQPTAYSLHAKVRSDSRG